MRGNVVDCVQVNINFFQIAFSSMKKAARWGALIVGIMYGRSRYNYLIKKEKPIQDEWDRLKAERKARLAKEWADYSDQQMQDLKRDSMRTD